MTLERTLWRARAPIVTAAGELGERWWVSIDGISWLPVDREPDFEDYVDVAKLFAAGRTSQAFPSSYVFDARRGGGADPLEPFTESAWVQAQVLDYGTSFCDN
jgi:hypothetical protein